MASGQTGVQAEADSGNGPGTGPQTRTLAATRRPSLISEQFLFLVIGRRRNNFSSQPSLMVFWGLDWEKMSNIQADCGAAPKVKSQADRFENRPYEDFHGKALEPGRWEVLAGLFQRQANSAGGAAP